MSLSNLRTTVFKRTKRIFAWLLYGFLGYLLVLLIGLIPANSNFEPAEDGVTIYVVSNAVHADLILPCSTETIDWLNEFQDFEFQGDIESATHVAFGWGDRGFFLETKTWDDLKISTAANALLIPSRSCMHVSFTRPEYYQAPTQVKISLAQYEQLVEFIRSSFAVDADQRPRQITDQAYSDNDAFFDAVGRYHILNTCNSWVGRGLKQAGVCVPIFSPMPKSPMLYIADQPDESDEN